MTDLRLLPGLGGVLVLGALALARTVRAGPPTQFDPAFTNDTIDNAGRTAGPHSLAAVPATFPTYTYASF